MLAQMKTIESDRRATIVAIDAERDAAAAEAQRAETALLLRVRDHGDRDAYRHLFEAFVPRLRSFALSQGCVSATAESVVQDVMITVWSRAHLFEPAKASARTWLYALVRNRLIDEHRTSGRRRRAYDDFVAEADTETAIGSHERDHHAARLAAALDGLPAEQADVVMMIYLEGRSHREIAERLDTPIGTVKSRLRLALQRLRKLMETPKSMEPPV
jgi:RNA polymerase sigma-70 factor (ECF subfamily)